MRKLIENNTGSAVPLIVFAMTIFSCGALYTLFFIEVAIPEFLDYIPDSDAKTFLMMCIYAIPLFVLMVCVIGLLKTGLKKMIYYDEVNPR